MMDLKKIYGILYFNIFRFHSFCFRWLGKPEYSFLQLNDQKHGSKNHGDDLIKNISKDTKGLISLNLTDRFMGLLYAFVVLSIWNTVSALLQLEFYFWKWGIYFWMVVAVLSIFASNHPYLKDFKEFNSWSINEKRKFAMMTILTVIVIFLAFIGSFALYFSHVVSTAMLA